jgi:hypothetical protein
MNGIRTRDPRVQPSKNTHLVNLAAGNLISKKIVPVLTNEMLLENVRFSMRCKFIL